VFSYPEAARHLGVTLRYPHPFEKCRGACLDTRELRKGDLFIALTGAHTDGHAFLPEAFRRGASGALVFRLKQKETDTVLSGCGIAFRNLLPVSDVQQALCELAGWHRSRLDIRAVGVTGSVGKTSTKEFLSYFLKYLLPDAFHGTRGNLNNHLGLPLTLLGLNSQHRLCVAELGANHKGEIAMLANMLQPTAAILTRIAPCHLQGFGSLEAVYDTKLELMASLKPGSVAIIPDDDPVLYARMQPFGLRAFRVGTGPEADYRVSGIEIREGWTYFTLNQNYRFAFPGLAGFLSVNAAFGLAMLEQLGFDLKKIPSRWEDFILPQGRFTLRRLGQDIRVIDDGYNANPESFAKALEVLDGMVSGGRKILIFADMLELGGESEKYHRLLGERIAQKSLDAVFAYGDLAGQSVESLCRANPALVVRHFPDAETLANFLTGFLGEGDTLLLKASRGMKIETIGHALSEHPRFRPKTADLSGART